MSTKPKKTDAKNNQSDRFESFRERAVTIADRSNLKTTASVTDEPFIIGEDYGVEPAISISKPTFIDRIALQQSLAEENIIEVLRLLFKSDFRRVLLILNDEGDDAELIALGIVSKVMEHFYGIGINDGLGFPKSLV